MAGRFLAELVIAPMPASRGLRVVAGLLLPLAGFALAASDLDAGEWRYAALAAALGVSSAAWSAWAVSPPTTAVLRTDGGWELGIGGPDRVPAELVHSWGARFGLVLGLEWRLAGGRRLVAWLSCRDVERDTWRRLRVRLRIA